VVLYLSGDNHGNVCYVGFLRYHLKIRDVRAFFDAVLQLFGETPIDPTGIEE
jgi:hypothetical protein